MEHNPTTERTAVFAEEAAVVEVQSLLHQLMENRGWSRADLARAMNVSRARVTQIFSDECTNLTVRLLARAMTALGEELAISVKAQSPDWLELLLEAERAGSRRRANPDKGWFEAAYYEAAQPAVANDNVLSSLAALRRIREETYELVAA